MNILEAFKKYEADKTILNYSKHTLKSYRLQARLLAEHIGEVELEHIKYEQLKDYLLANVEKLKPSSLGHRIRFIRSLFRWATDEGYINKNPASGLREPNIGMRIPKALSEEDIETLREACETPLEHAIVEFLYTTGCRIGEAVKVNIVDINWDKKSLIVNGKGNKDREVYFNMKCYIWLKKYLESRNDEDPALFVTQRNPHRMSIAQMRFIVKRIARRSGVKANIYPHALRHTYATHLLNNGAPMEVIQSCLGHEKSSTTQLYAHLSGERRRELYRRYF